MTDASADTLGPIDFLVVQFPGNKFNGRVLPALTDLIARGLVRVMDLAFVAKDADGNVVMGELEDLPGDETGGLHGLSAFIADVVSEEDLNAIADELEPNSSAAVLVWENRWAVPFVTAVRESDGEVVSSGRLASAAVLGALADATT
jgi:Family of unknown function (DUF6325)